MIKQKARMSLSPHLSNLILEVLTNAIRQEKEVKSNIDWEGRQNGHFFFFFADDMTAYYVENPRVKKNFLESAIIPRLQDAS